MKRIYISLLVVLCTVCAVAQTLKIRDTDASFAPMAQISLHGGFPCLAASDMGGRQSRTDNHPSGITDKRLAPQASYPACTENLRYCKLVQNCTDKNLFTVYIFAYWAHKGENGAIFKAVDVDFGKSSGDLSGTYSFSSNRNNCIQGNNYVVDQDYDFGENAFGTITFSYVGMGTDGHPLYDITMNPQAYQYGSSCRLWTFTWGTHQLTVKAYDCAETEEINVAQGIIIPLDQSLVWQDNTQAADTWHYLSLSGVGKGSDNKTYDVRFDINTSSPIGTFSAADIDWTNTYIRQGNTNIAAASVTSFQITSPSDGKYELEATIIGTDGNTYVITGTFTNCERQVAAEGYLLSYKFGTSDVISCDVFTDPADYDGTYGLWYYGDMRTFIRVRAYNNNSTNNYFQFFLWVGDNLNGNVQTYANGVGPKEGTYTAIDPEIVVERDNYDCPSTIWWSASQSAVSSGKATAFNQRNWSYYSSYCGIDLALECPYSAFVATRQSDGTLSGYGGIEGSTITVQTGKNGNMYITVDYNGATAISIGEPVPSDGYRLGTYVNGKGSVTKAPDECFYAAGSQVTLTPTPETGWNFTGWTGECTANITDNGNGTYTYTIPTKDCAVTANFTIHDFVVENRYETARICHGTTYDWPEHPDFSGLSEEADYKDTIRTVVGGADSIYCFLHLYVQPEVEIRPDADNACSDDLWNGYEWTPWEGHTVTVDISDTETDYDLEETESSKICDCDSIIHRRHLHVFMTTQDQEAIEVCGPTYEYTAPWGETRTFTYPEDYVEMTHAVEGSGGQCESSVGVSITWKQPEPYHVNDGTTLCASELAGFEWKGLHFTPDNLTRTKTLESVNGCDSIVTFTVTLLPVYDDITDGTTICSSALDEFTWEDEHFTPTDLVKTKTLRTAAGCDSTVTFTLTVSDAYRITDGTSICPSELEDFTWEDLPFTPDNLTQEKTLEAANGCDSVVTFTVTLLPTYNTTDGASVCENELAAFEWEGLHFTPDNLTQTKILPAANGCDSIVTLHLTIVPEMETVETYDSVCSLDLWDDYQWEVWPGHTIAVVLSDDQTDYELHEMRHSQVYDYDSVYYVRYLHIYPATQEQDFIEVCGKTADYTDPWGGTHTFYYPSDYEEVTHLVEGSTDCESVVGVNITWKQPEPYQINDGTTLCASELASFEWEDMHFTPDNLTQTKTLESVNGCDSIVTFTVTLLPVYDDITDGATICSSALDEFTWEGEHFTPTDLVKTKTLPTAAGCDSTVTFTVTLLPTYNTTDGASVCENELAAFEWEGLHFTPDNLEQTKTLPAANGCDSTVTFMVTLLATSHTDIEVTACDSYEWNGETYTDSDPNITYQTTNAAGCDSTAILHLTILKPTTSEETVTACDSYEWNGETYTESDPNITYETTNAAGCDSTAILHLTILKSTAGEETVTACDSYTWNGVEYTESDPNITYETTNAAGCDSTAILHLTILKSTIGEETVTACDSYEWNGDTYTESNPNITYETTNAAGCDSTAILHLTILKSTTGEETVTACDSYTWNDVEYTESDPNITYETTNAAGCDSTAILHLTIRKSTMGEETVTACDSYTWNGVEYTESDLNITYETTNAAGCDSTVILHLTILKSTMGEETVTACDSYTWNGETYTRSNDNITYKTTNAAGCDSTAVLHLTITHSTQSEKSLKIFSNQLPYTWDNITFTEEHDVDTVLVLQGANAQGCDSTVIRHLAVDLCIDLKADIVFNNATFCADEGDAHATLQVREGRPVSYSVSYPVKDRDGYLQDVSDVALPSGKTFDIVIPVNPATDKERYLRPDDYPVDVTVTDICGIRWELPRMMLHVLYPSWLIVQKWDDVLALYNERYNGGYTFSRIGWYNDGLPVEGQGANNSYIYVNRGQGEMLRFGTPYWAELTREDDGKTICTCPYVPQRMQQAPERKGMEISFAQRGYQLLLTTEQNGTYALYDVTGKTLQTGSFVGQSGTQQIDIDRSCAAGSYLIVFRADDGTTETRKFAIY